ncbi:MAG: nitroreductase family protein [Peptostreptococcaceae bacterium]
MELYDAIFYRKSTRNYSNKKVIGQLMNEVKEICSEIADSNGDLNIKANVVERGHLIHFSMGKKFKIKAPHYIIVTCKKGEDYLQKVGFAIEEIVLHLTTLGLATCWLECDLKTEDVIEFTREEEYEYTRKNDTDEEQQEDEEEVEKEEPVILIAFGYPEESEVLFRDEEKQLDRKSIKHICKKSDKKYEFIIEAIRLSPSFKNYQPWVLYKSTDGFNLYEEKQKKNNVNMSKISMGVALKHLDLACKKYGLSVSYEKQKCKKKIGKEYYTSAIIK